MRGFLGIAKAVHDRILSGIVCRAGEQGGSAPRSRHVFRCYGNGHRGGGPSSPAGTWGRNHEETQPALMCCSRVHRFAACCAPAPQTSNCDPATTGGGSETPTSRVVAGSSRSYWTRSLDC